MSTENNRSEVDMNSDFSAHSRTMALKRMETETFDMVIIGGGITGAGVARDAASRGMTVALIESRDFAEGTSSRSSKLIHGGIRYLENFEFHLVFEALSERRLLFEIAPHLVHPLRFMLPLYKNSRVGMFKMGLGMWLYDALSLFEAPEMHERLNAKETSERFPELNADDLVGSFVYSDAYMDDDRLVHETMRSAVSMGAICANYIKAVDVEIQKGKVVALEAKDLVSGKKIKIRGRHFVSTTGPWTDQVAVDLLKTWKKVLRPTKGVHLTFARDRIPLTEAVVMAADNDRRIVFAIPRNDMIIIGTTDTDFTLDPAEVSCLPEDVDYLLGVAREYFPGANLTRSDIIGTYAGVRPLVSDGENSESKTSREHLIYIDPRGITFVAGGKYTTYRKMAEQAVDRTLEGANLEERMRFARSSTKVAINPRVTNEGIDFALRQAAKKATTCRLKTSDLERLIHRHGPEAFDILERRIAHPLPILQDSDPENFIWQAEALHAIRSSMCLHLSDFYMRRTPLFLSCRDHGLSLLSAITDIFAHEFKWSQAQINEEQEALRAVIARETAWATS
jgi:glycerol-3-phosphate dehydrogenase